MLSRSPGARTQWSAKDNRNLCLPTKHVAYLRPLIDNLIHANRHKIAKLEFSYRPHTGERGSNGRSGDDRLRDRSIANTLLSKLVEQVTRDTKGPAIDTNIFSHQEDSLVPQHFFAQRRAHRLRIRHLPQRSRFGCRAKACRLTGQRLLRNGHAYTPSSNCSGFGSG